MKESIGRQLAVPDGGPGKWGALVKRNMGPELQEKFRDGLVKAAVPHDIPRAPEKGM